MTRRTLLLPVIASLVIAGCSEQETSPVSTGQTATLPPVSATTTLPVTTSTDAPVDATTVPTSTAPPTTVAPTTTIGPPSGPPIDATIPLLIGGGGDGGGWLSLGTWASTDWRPATTPDGTPIVPSIAADSTLAVTGLQAGAATGVTGANVEACFDGRVGPTLDAAVSAPTPPGFGYSAIALPAIWPLQPRPVVDIDATIPAYQAAAAAIFVDAPVDGSRGTVEQIVLADLDGDGDEEALLAFEHVQDSILGAPGDLAAVLVIDTATGSATTVESTFVGPIEEPVGTEAPGRPIIDRFRILGVADLNGDGVMEVAVHTWYFEGAAVLLYEYDGTSLTEVLSSGCGA